MAKQSRRAARVNRHHGRSKNASLSLTSLMDVFTILVFFLLVNSAEQQPPNLKDMALPDSIANKPVKPNLVVLVNKKTIIVQGRTVTTVGAAAALKEDLVPELLAELERQSIRIKKSTTDPEKRKEITIMGDKEIPYKLLRKLMSTCAEGGFTNISLAVMKKAGPKADG